MADISGFNVGGQYVSPELYGIYEKQTHTGKVSGLLVKQNTTPNMTVLVEPGIALLDKGSFSSVVAGVKSNTSLTIATANPSNPRIDAIVVYEDIAVTMPSVEPYSVDASNGRFKMVVVAGTPGAVPTAPSDPTIQSTIGAGNTSWTRLATVRVEAGTTTIVNSKIDNTIRSSLGSLLAPGQVTADKIDFTTYSTTEKVVGTWIDGKTIYSRTFTGSITGAAGSRPTQQLTTGVDTLVSAEGTWRYGDAVDAPWVPIGHVITTGAGAINTNIGLDIRREDNTNVTVSSTTTYARTTGTNYQITLKYTKS